MKIRIHRYLAGATLLVCLGICQSGVMAGQISNRQPSDLEIGYLPSKVRPVTSNPPVLGWLDEPGATSWTLQIARDKNFSDIAVRVDDWPWLIYTHTEPLKPGTYHWRYRFVDNDEKASGWSQARSFKVSEEHPEFPRISSEKLDELIPKERPRMFTRPEKLASLRESAQTSSTALTKLLKEADSYMKNPLMLEPLPWTDGKWNMPEWSEYYRAASTSTAQMNVLAFAWLLTGEERYGARAKEHLLNYAAWDPLGPSSQRVNDEVGMPVLYSMARCYDWLYPILTEDDKKLVLEAVRARGEETFSYMRRPNRPYDQFVFNSHFGRMWHFLGEAGVAFYWEIPEAKNWLNYSMTIFYGWYPTWGTADGGWAEGIRYWGGYNDKVTWWLDLMLETLEVDGAAKPFYQNVGEFPLWVSPPGNPVGGFGDFSESPAPREHVGRTMDAFALFRNEPTWKWLADAYGAGLAPEHFGYIRSLRRQPEARVPENLPLMKTFDAVGYALFHSDLINVKNNIHIAMRSSPFGNISHNHNDQGAIVMAAYGKPLLVKTGTRDFYNSEFCKQYYWQTQSSNAMLFDGKGQPRSPKARGQFVAEGETDNLAWVVGDVSPAYSGLVDSYRRWTIFLPDNGAILIDEFKTTASQATLLFHGRAPFTWSEQEHDFSLTMDDVKLSGQIVTLDHAAALAYRQTDEYPLPMADNKKPIFDEWHLAVDVPLDGWTQDTRYIITTLDVTKTDTQANDERWLAQREKDVLTLTRGDADTTGAIELKIDLKKPVVERK